ncbi:hypothetical protein JDV02_009902 [Purpureocillium takamizusanense]|uniref:Uncharacterized protein n=1 Tax=Purpureocillium takamizusanense TaxID=2060973 RepID=A0A9Q8QR08_9HYPO|nr:uncharacterized protein JDV02_009902 [Purpureocillium takamizusanense]UNI24128.1 hypothetical protein JDV02_009902 [Purpureocillium takamizusanense]
MGEFTMMSPDTVSSLFPDRPIRPLPKRRLRERLSPEAAGSIKYPPSTLDNVPLFYYPPYTAKDDGAAAQANGEPAAALEHGRRPDPPSFQSLRNGVRPPAGEEQQSGPRSTLITRPQPDMLTRAARRPSRPDPARAADPQPPPSATSSVDGYDSFENSNKKKRKIPSASDSVLNGAGSLSSDLSSLGISGNAHSPTDDAGERLHHGSAGYSAPGSYASANQGFSGPGRGRLGRSRNGRSPLRALADGNSVWPGRSSKGGTSPWSPAPEGTGIISSAIANAEKHPPQGQENVSLLQQHSATPKPTPASTQFTFTCDSQVPGTVQWPGHPNRHAMSAQASPPGPNAPNGANHEAAPGAAGTKSAGRRKSRRRLDRELDVAARQRKQMAADIYYHQPPRPEDVWICEFCEFESIFGRAPLRLIRDYEIKDRRHRQEEADRKRLLEKAKAKSRKARKSGKPLGKGGHGTQAPEDPRQPDPQDDQDATPMQHSHSHSTQSEDEYEDDFEDDYPSPPPERVPPLGDGRGGVLPMRSKP